MKKLYLLLALALPIAACTPQNVDPENTDPLGTEETVPDPDPEEPQLRPEPEPVIYQEPFLVTSPIFMQFIQNVTYDERDYTYTHVMDEPYAPYGAPGNEDLPPTVPISWEAYPEEGPLTLSLQEGNGEWGFDLELPAGTTSYELSSLVPGKTYSYMVIRNDLDRIVGRGSFTTTGLIHQTYFQPKVRNSRDLGGWTTTDGKRVKYRKLYRGGDLGTSFLNNKGIQEMLRQGIRAELDLREAEDLKGATTSRLGKDISFFNANMKKAYGTLIRDYPEKVAAAFKFTVQCVRDGEPLYFHCSIGRDRTGTMAALFLGLLGVSESDISKEYELLYFSPSDWSLNGGATEFKYSRVYRWAHRYTCDTLWELGGQALGVADNNYNVTFKQRIEAYLLAHGVPQKDIDDFRALMLE